MRLHHELTVTEPLARVWEVLLDAATRIEVDTDLHVTGQQDELPTPAAEAAMADILVHLVSGVEKSIAASSPAVADRSVAASFAAVRLGRK